MNNWIDRLERRYSHFAIHYLCLLYTSDAADEL